MSSAAGRASPAFSLRSPLTPVLSLGPPWNRNRFNQSRRPEMYEQKQILDGDALVREAITYLEGKLRKPGEALTSPDTTRTYLRTRLLNRRYEHFAAILLDTRHRIIAYRELFHGTLDAAHVHPRVVVKQALDDHAAAIILAHNPLRGR